MNNDKHKALTEDIIAQIPDLYIAELVQVSDFIKSLKTARKFMGLS